jgi:hypothetical protein
MNLSQCYFSGKKKSSRSHSDTKFSQGSVSYTVANEKRFHKRHSSLRPSEKELPQQRSSVFLHKNTLELS